MNLKMFLGNLRKGSLTVDDFGKGMHLAYKNAESLRNDAKALLETSPGRAISLAVLAIEELGKVVALADGAVHAAAGPVEWQEVQRKLNLKSHQHKQRLLAQYGRRLNRKYEQELPAGISPLLDAFKQYGLYVDVAMGEFYAPNEFGAENREWAEWLIAIADERLTTFSKLHATEEQSMKVARGAVLLVEAVAKSRTEEELRQNIVDVVRSRLAKRGSAG